jgi:hypothetical protein
MQITPKNVFRGTNSDGTKFSAEEYDFTTFAQLEAAHVIVMLIAGLLFSSIASLIILVVALHAFTGRVIVPHVLGIVFAAYFLIDAYNGWLTLTVLSMFVSESTINFLIALNAGALVTHLVLAIFGWNIALFLRKKETTQDKLVSFIGIVAAVLIGTFIITSRIVGSDKNKGWVDQKTIMTDIKDK